MRTNILMLCFTLLVLSICSVGAQADNHIILTGKSVGLDIKRDPLQKASAEQDYLTITTKIDVTVQGVKIIASGTKVPYLLISDEKQRRSGERSFWELKFIIISITTEYGQVVMINDTIVIRYHENSLTYSYELKLPDTKCTYNDPSKFTLKQGYPFNIETVQDHILSEFSVGDGMEMRLKSDHKLDSTTCIPKGTIVYAYIYYASPDTVKWGFAEMILEDRTIEFRRDTIFSVRRKSDDAVLLRKGTFKQGHTAEAYQFNLKAPQQNQLPIISGPKLAILIAAQDYQHLNTLQNTHNDLDSMAQFYQQFGFEVWIYRNVTKDTLDALQKRLFALPANKYSLISLYYSGHGCTYHNLNYLLPIDYQPLPDTFNHAKALPLNAFVSAIRCPRQIIVTDACRDVPPTKNAMRLLTQPFGSGFNEPVQDDIRRITVHATLTGQTASDNHPTKKNGLFTGLLMDCIAQYRCEIPFPQVFTDVINRLPHQAPQLNTEMPPFKLVCEQ